MSGEREPVLRVPIDLGERRYDIAIGDGILGSPEAWPTLPAADTAVVVTNPTVDRHHGRALRSALVGRYRRVLGIELPDGEVHKTWEAIDSIITSLLRHACDRKTTLFALGGGVIGDTTGFAAACYMRGVPFVQVPTTLLAQVDSSVGGKTAINHPLGKNMIGAFHQPVAVVCDLATLDTLPEREFRSGLAEVIKYGPIADAAFFEWLEDNLEPLLARERRPLAHAVERSCRIKADIVARDERENDVRATLNFGHTFGHAIEGATGYGAWLHGEAVACGMALASQLSVRLGLIESKVAQRIVRVIERVGLPVQPPALPWSTWSSWLRVDKKAEAGAVRFVVLASLGSARVQPVDDGMIEALVSSSA